MPFDIPSTSTATQPSAPPRESRLRLPISDLLNDRNHDNSLSRPHSPARFNTRPDGFIDLTTEDSTSPPQPHSLFDSPISESEFIALLEEDSPPPQSSFSSDNMPRQKKVSDAQQNARKKRRLNDGTSTLSGPTTSHEEYQRSLGINNLLNLDSPPSQVADEVLDLTEVEGRDALQKAQDQQREKRNAFQEQQNQMVQSSIQAQEPENKGPFKLGQLQCVICMDNMTDMTATHCGHLFCHTCIMEALIAGENQGDNGKGLPRCPSCRTKVVRNPPKGGPNIIPLALKFTTKSEKARGKERATS